MNPDLHILGGGPAGLATAYFAQQKGLRARIYEAGPEAGGNCRTLKLGPCRYDTGAHRLHLRNPEATQAFHDLLGKSLLEVHAPSAIVTGGNLLRFPPGPADLLRQLGLGALGLTALELGWNRIKGMTHSPSDEATKSFGSLAHKRYGKTLSELFLLNYTRKLWGCDPFALSSQVSGGRLRGLNPLAWVKEQLGFGVKGIGDKANHLDGKFLYPEQGIGSLFEALIQRLEHGSLQLNQAVTGIHHDGRRILSVTVTPKGSEHDGSAAPPETVATAGNALANTLPLPVFLRALSPAPPAEILAAADGITFRQLLLAVLVIDMDKYTAQASLYFPDAAIPFTRVYEPKNRSPHLAPPGKTCLVIEIPCDANHAWWQKGEVDLSALLPHFHAVKPISPGQVLHQACVRIPNAYPVLELGVEKRIAVLLDYCRRFENLWMVGRNARFEYAHIHDLFAQGAEAATEVAKAITRLRLEAIPP